MTPDDIERAGLAAAQRELEPSSDEMPLRAVTSKYIA